MKDHHPILVGLVLLCMLSLGFSPASAIPPLPSSFYGTVQVNGANVPAGLPITAWIDGTQYAITYPSIYSGYTVYSLNVPGDDPSTPGIEGGKQNDVITFKVGGIPANLTGVWQAGTNTQINLSITAYLVFLPCVQH